MTARVEAFANPQVLVWARRMAGLTVEEAARKAQVKPERITDWEKGERRPTITQLRKLADIYKRPLAVFFLQTPPPDESLPSDFRRFDPEAAEPLSPELRLAIRDARTRREAALELFDEIDEQPPEFALAAQLTDDAEGIGARLRTALTAGAWPAGGDPRIVFNFWRAAAEKSGVLVFQAEGVPVEEMRGFSISDRPLPAVVLNIKDAYAGRSFSLLHELAHVMLNRGGLCVFDERGPQTGIRRIEVFCNHVAGAALLPADSLLREAETPHRRVQQIPDNAVGALAQRYGTSKEAVLRRLVILNRVTLAFYQRMRQEYQRPPKPGRPTPGFAPPYTMAVARGGPLFTRLVLEVFDEDRITASDVAEHLGVRLKHLERIRDAIRKEPVIGGPA